MTNERAKALAEKVSNDKKCDYEMCYSPHDFRSPEDNPSPYWVRIGDEEGQGDSWEPAFLAAGVRVCDCDNGMETKYDGHGGWETSLVEICPKCGGQGFTKV